MPASGIIGCRRFDANRSGRADRALGVVPEKPIRSAGRHVLHLAAGQPTDLHFLGRIVDRFGRIVPLGSILRAHYAEVMAVFNPLTIDGIRNVSAGIRIFAKGLSGIRTPVIGMPETEVMAEFVTCCPQSSVRSYPMRALGADVRYARVTETTARGHHHVEVVVGVIIALRRGGRSGVAKELSKIVVISGAVTRWLRQSNVDEIDRLSGVGKTFGVNFSP